MSVASRRWEIEGPHFSKFGSTFKAGRKAFYAAAMTVVVADIIKGIQGNKSMTGSSFPALEPETVALKGHARPLINAGLLSQDYTYQKLNKYLTDSGEITIKPLTRTLQRSNKKKGIEKITDTPRDEVGGMLQINGIDSKRGKKHFYFFGVSKEANELILDLIDQLTLESLEAM